LGEQGLGGTFLGIGRYYWVKVWVHMQCQAELGSIEITYKNSL